MSDTDDFATRTRALLAAHGTDLLGLARRSIEHGLTTQAPVNVDMDGVAPALKAPGASFVTLNKDGLLRGCIGSAEAWRPLARDVAENAFNAAFHDPRFAPLRAEETQALDIHISILSPPQPLAFRDEADLLAKLKAGEDGLIIEDHGRRALFLPSVWTQLPEPAAFLAHLKAKAGMPLEPPSPTLRAHHFIAAQISMNWRKIPS